MNRAVKIFVNRRHWLPPRGATHVFQWIPPQLLVPALHDPDDGLWELTALDHFLAGTPDGDAAGMFGPSDVPEGDLIAFIRNERREAVALVSFSVEIEFGGAAFTVPAYYLTPAGA